MQGKSPPGKRSVAKENLPAPTTPTCLQGEASLIEFQVPEDRTGEAVIKFGQTRARRAIDSKNSPSADINDPEVVCPVLPDTPQHKQSLDIDIHIPSSPSTPPSCSSTPPSHLVTPTTKVLSSGAVSNSITSVAHTPVVVNPTEPKKTRKRKIPPTKKQTQLFPQPTPYYFPPRTPYQPIPHFQPIFNPLYQPFTQQQPLTQQQLFMYTPYPSYPFMPAPTSQTPAPKKERKNIPVESVEKMKDMANTKDINTAQINQHGVPDYQTWLRINEKRTTIENNIFTCFIREVFVS